jgi:hypothetical protein
MTDSTVHLTAHGGGHSQFSPTAASSPGPAGEPLESAASPPDDAAAVPPPGDDGPVSFEKDIKPLFREGDRRSMHFAFDLWCYDDVSSRADGILQRLEDGSMPCDGAWPPAQIQVFRNWTETGRGR